MIRYALLAIVLSLSGCAEPPPPAVDGEIVRHAVELAQARADGPRPAAAYAAADQAELGQ
jgi:hypothetical protein